MSKTTAGFPEGVHIMTGTGMKKVEDLRMGDTVITYTGEVRKISEVNSIMSETVILHGQTVDLECAPNQLIYSLDPRDGLLYSYEEECYEAVNMGNRLYAIPVAVGVTCPYEPIKTDRFCYWYFIRSIEKLYDKKTVFQFSYEGTGGFIADGVICFDEFQPE